MSTFDLVSLLLDFIPPFRTGSDPMASPCFVDASFTNESLLLLLFLSFNFTILMSVVCDGFRSKRKSPALLVFPKSRE